MNLNQKLLFILMVSFSINMSAQLKVGNNPTTLNTNTNLQVEAQSGGQVVITRDSGKVGIGTLSPAAKLDVIGKVKITDGTEGTGKVLVSDANGQASWQNASTLQAITKDSTSASNGLTLSGKEVQLGGTLTKATTITTSATNTIALGGLQSGATSDSILVVNPSTGVVARKSAAAIAAGATTNEILFNSSSKILTSIVNGKTDTTLIDFPTLDTTSASNGLTLSSKEVQLGGTLTKATTITTSATNTIAIGGLQSGTATDSILVSNPSTGVVRRISPSVLGAGSEPWYNVATNTGATANTQNIYQMGRVGINTISPTQQLHLGNTGNVTANKTYNGITDDGFSFNHYINTSGENGNSFARVGDIVVASSASSSAGAGVLRFLTSTNAEQGGTITEKMRIHTNGNVGIGVTNPSVRLEVNGSISTRLNAGIGSVRLSPGLASNSGYIEFFNSNTSTRAGYIGFANNGNLLYTAENGNRHYFQGSGIYIAGTNTYNIGNFVFYSNTVYTSGTNGFYTGVSGASNNAYSIYAVDRVACAEVNIFSDRRVKNVIGTSNANQDLATLMKLSIKDYTMKDFIENGNRKFKKVIAQEVEEVFPQAISQSKNAIPNIFSPAKAHVLENQIELTLSKTHELKSQDTLKIYFAGKEKQIKVLETPNNKTIRISKQDIDLATLNDVFVYGQYVHDFRTVDYDALSMLNISATQELYRKIEALEKQNQQLLQLQSGFETLKAEIQNLKKDMNKDLSLKNH